MRVGGAAAAKGQHHAGALALVGVRFLADDAPGGSFSWRGKAKPRSDESGPRRSVVQLSVHLLKKFFGHKVRTSFDVHDVDYKDFIRWFFNRKKSLCIFQ
jgi:hypothetical protein